MKISNTGPNVVAGTGVTVIGEATGTRHIEKHPTSKKPAATAAGDVQDRYQQTPGATAFERLIGPNSGPMPDQSGSGEYEAMNTSSLISRRSPTLQRASKILSDTARSARGIVGNTGK